MISRLCRFRTQRELVLCMRAEGGLREEEGEPAGCSVHARDGVVTDQEANSTIMQTRSLIGTASGTAQSVVLCLMIVTYAHADACMHRHMLLRPR